MNLKKKDGTQDQTLLSNHLDIQKHHQEILEDLLHKPALQQPEVINTKKPGLSTPNQRYAKKLEATIKERKNKKLENNTF